MARVITTTIKTMLEDKHITQKELSEMTGITESAISHYVRGTRVPRGSNLIKIAKALGTTTDELLNGDQELDKERDLVYAKALIARNASNMSMDERMDFLKLLMVEGVKNETG